MQAVDALRRFMQQKQFSICNDAVYRKITESKFTYVYFGSVNTFLLQSLGNAEIADQIVSSIKPLTHLLSQPKCALIKPINIDYNFIEVQPTGTCFDIWNKRFVKNPVDLKGSPRAFARYKYVAGIVPKPRLFIEGMCPVGTEMLPQRCIYVAFKLRCCAMKMQYPYNIAYANVACAMKMQHIYNIKCPNVVSPMKMQHNYNIACANVACTLFLQRYCSLVKKT